MIEETQQTEEATVIDYVLLAHEEYISAMRIARLQVARLPGSFNNDKLIADISNIIVNAEIEHADFLESQLNPLKIRE